MTDYIHAYQTYLAEEKHASANTLSSYVRDITQFQAWLLQKGAMDLRKVKKDTISAYLQHLQQLDRMKVQQDMMRLQLEDMQLAARNVMMLCKEFLALLPEEKQGNLDAFCRELTSRLTVLENAAN